MKDKIKEKLLKGCRKDWFDSETGGLYESCGDDGELCNECKAKIQQHEETSKAKDEEFIKSLKSLKEDFFKQSVEVENFIECIEKEIKQRRKEE